MAVLALLFMLVQSLVQYPQPAGDGLDEATRQRIQERQELLEHEMARLLQELEQGPLEQHDEGWGALLFDALQQWPFWVLVGVLLLLGLWLSHRRRSREDNSDDNDQSSWKSSGEEEEEEREEDPFDSKEDRENIDVATEADDRSTGSECEGSPASANEGEGVDVNEGNEDVKFNKDSEVKSEEGHDFQKDEGGSDGSVPGDNTVEGNDEERGRVGGNTEGPDEENESENEDVKVEQDKDAGKEEGDGNEERNGANMKAGNNVDSNEGEYEADGKEESTDVKAQESSDASEQSSKDWIAQEDNRDGGKAVGHSEFAATEQENTDLGNEEISVSNKDQKNGDANVKEEKNVDGKEEQGNMAASENEGSDGRKEVAGSGETEEEEDAPDIGKKRGILLVDRIQGPVEDLDSGCSVIAELMESFMRVFADNVSNGFYPVPQGAIGVGNAFEGWSASERDVVYHVLVPLNPPSGHVFRLEQDSAGQMAARTFRVRVDMTCMCKKEQLGEKLCFLHHSKEELRQQQKPSLLETLCINSYLDVEKTSRWFYQMAESLWLHLPQSHSWHLMFQPCSRSCRFRLRKGQKILTVETLFGVRQGDSDIFVVSQPPEAQKGGPSPFVSSHPTMADFISSTAWPETYAVAEAKFFRNITRQMPCKALHLKCLQVFTCILRGAGFSSSTWKTVLMHVLTTVPLSSWRRREFERRLWNVMAYMRRCLQLKRLDHFVLGNGKLPAEISVPPEMRVVEPLNLFEHLARNPAAHAEAMRAYSHMRLRLWVLLSSR